MNKKKSKKYIPLILNYNVKQHSDYQTLTNDPGVSSLVISRTEEALKEAIKLNKPFIKLFEVDGKDIILERKDYRNSLNVCIQKRSDAEEYEVCSELQKLIKTI